MGKHRVSLQTARFIVWLLQGEIGPLLEGFQQCLEVDFQPFFMGFIASLAPVFHIVFQACEFREDYLLDPICVRHYGCGDFDEVGVAFSMLLEPKGFPVAVSDLEHAGMSWGTEYIDPSIVEFSFLKCIVQCVGHIGSDLIGGEADVRGLWVEDDWVAFDRII